MSNEKKTLTPEDIVTKEKVGRRDALGLLGAAVVGAAVVSVGSGRAKAQTDSDTGPGADRAGGGRTGGTDSDTGPRSDRAGHGSTGSTDSDTGPSADRAGRGGSGRSDSDSGPGADRAGHGH